MNNIRNFFTDAIHKKLIISVIVFILLPVTAIFIYTFNWFDRTLSDNATQTALNSMESIGNNLTKTKEKIMNVAKIAVNNKNVNIATNENHKISYEENKLIEDLLIDLNSDMDMDFHITVIPKAGGIYANWPRDFLDYSYFRKENWFIDCISQKVGFYWIAPQKQYIQHRITSEKYLISFAMPISDASLVPQGVILVSIDGNNLFREIFLKEPNPFDAKTFLVNSDGIIICDNKQENAGKKIDSLKFDQKNANTGYKKMRINNKETLVSYLTVDENTGWKIVQYIPYSNVVKATRTLMKKVLILSIILLFLIIIALLTFSSRITSPIRKLEKVIKEVGKGNMNVSIAIGGNDEMNKLGKEFNRMVIKQKELIEKIAEEEHLLAEEQRRKEEFKFEMLMAQINPHFLFNTLNTIKWTALMSGAGTVGKMISSLGNLLEMSINRGNDIITLSEEIENVKSYMYIQKIRFDNRFSVEYDISPDTEKLQVPKFILQPLVENSIIHGFEGSESEGKISISANKEEDFLVIRVSDNGKGIDSDTLNKLLSIDNSNTHQSRLSGIGVNNVNQRIKLYCGNENGIRIKSEIGKGTVIKILLKLKNEGQDQ